MRLQQYLNEVFDEDIAKERIELIWKKCQPFLKQMKSSNFENENLLYSGRRTGSQFAKKKVRKNRRPKDTPLDIHEWVDEWFYNKFGIRARSNTVFCINNRNYAMTYGKAYVVFPIGKFEVIWSHAIEDLYDKATMDMGLEYWKNDFLSTYTKTYKKGDLQGALKSGHEIMLHCKEYYMLEFYPSVNAMVLNHFMETL